MKIFRNNGVKETNNSNELDSDFQKRTKEKLLAVEETKEHQDKLVEKESIKRKKYKYDTKISKELLSTLNKEEDSFHFTIDTLLEYLNISVKNYHKLFQELRDCKSKHIYSEISNIFLNLLFKIIYQLYKLSFSSEHIKYFLGDTLTKDTIIKYLKIETVRKNRNSLKQKEYIIVFIEKPKIDKSSKNTLEDIQNREFSILKKIETKRRSNKVFYKLVYIDTASFHDYRSKEIEIISEMEIASIKKSRIYKKILIN